MTYVVLSHCIHHLLEVRDDALTSHTRQCLLSEVSTDVSWPIISKLDGLQDSNQGHQP